MKIQKSVFAFSAARLLSQKRLEAACPHIIVYDAAQIHKTNGPHLFADTIAEVNEMDQLELPLGFGMALAQNEPALKRFESYSEAEKQAIIQKTHSITSKQEMRAFVNELGQTVR